MQEPFSKVHCVWILVTRRDILDWLRNLSGSSHDALQKPGFRWSFFFNQEKPLVNIFGKPPSASLRGFDWHSGLQCYVWKAAAFALTSSIARTKRSHKSRELRGRMTGGGLISVQESPEMSSSLGRNSCSLAWCWSESEKSGKNIYNSLSTTNTGTSATSSFFA